MCERSGHHNQWTQLHTRRGTGRFHASNTISEISIDFNAPTEGIYVFSENGADQIVDSTPLAGDFTQSMASASVTVPSGYSRMFVRATWTP